MPHLPSMHHRSSGGIRLLGALVLGVLLFVRLCPAQERSQASDLKVTITIQNSTAASVEMIWIDLAGREKSYGAVPPGESRELETFATHVWHFKQNGQLLGSYVAGRAAQQFYNILATNAKTLSASDFVCDVQDPLIKFDARGFTLPQRPLSVWSKEQVYDLDQAPGFSLEFDALFTHPKQEMIIACSRNKLPWGQPGADALTVRVSPSDQDFWFRTGFYQDWLETTLYYGKGEEVIALNQWQHFAIELTPNNVFVLVEGDTIATASMAKAAFPRSGSVGFIVFGNPEIKQTMISYENIVLHSGPGVPSAPIAMQLGPPPPSGNTLGTSGFVCDVNDPRIKFGAHGFTLPQRALSVWSKEQVYDLIDASEFSLEYDAFFTHPSQEMIIAFSHNKVPWGQPAADALTVRVSPKDQDFWFRTGFYQDWLETTLYYDEGEKIISEKKWQHFEIKLTRKNIFVFVDHDTVATASLERASYPRSGFVGFIVYGNSEIEQTMISYENIVLHRMTAGPPAAIAMQPEPAQPPAEPATRNIRPVGNPDANANSTLSSPGRYYALIIAVQDYNDDTLDLDHPVQDAQNVVNTLTANYTFAPEDLTFLKNPTKSQITDAFDQLIDKVTTADNLLIFFAGHGHWDERLQQGFWMPADAEKGRRNNWLSNGTVRDYIQGLRTKHTLLITDACFSGGIFKTRAADFTHADRATEELYKMPSRKAMTSGTGKEEVPDKSVFISYLIKRLQENSDQYLPSQKLFTSLREPVINNSPNSQVPLFGVIRETGDEDGEFIFVHKK